MGYLLRGLAAEASIKPCRFAAFLSIVAVSVICQNP
jgi:hypothetical protein